MPTVDVKNRRMGSILLLAAMLLGFLVSPVLSEATEESESELRQEDAKSSGGFHQHSLSKQYEFRAGA